MSVSGPDREQPQASDLELVHAMARGDAQALASFYDRYYSTLFGFLLRILHDSSEAEDVLQEVFLQVWERASNYDETRGRPFTWVVTITHSRAIDRLRSINARTRLMERVAHESPSEIHDATHDAISAEQCEMVRGALDEIPEESRRAILLAYFEGLSQSEIAEQIEAPLGTVKTRTRKGLRMLREILQNKLGRGGRRD